MFCYSRPKENLPCSGADLTEATATARSRHPGGVNVLFADGTVHFVSQDIDLKVWQALGTISGGEVVGNY
jgi:prepilin-type processing-associated H-X9-DG protein